MGRCGIDGNDVFSNHFFDHIYQHPYQSLSKPKILGYFLLHEGSRFCAKVCAKWVGCRRKLFHFSAAHSAVLLLERFREVEKIIENIIRFIISDSDLCQLNKELFTSCKVSLFLKRCNREGIGTFQH